MSNTDRPNAKRRKKIAERHASAELSARRCPDERQAVTAERVLPVATDFPVGTDHMLGVPVDGELRQVEGFGVAGLPAGVRRQRPDQRHSVFVCRGQHLTTLT